MSNVDYNTFKNILDCPKEKLLIAIGKAVMEYIETLPDKEGADNNMHAKLEGFFDEVYSKTKVIRSTNTQAVSKELSEGTLSKYVHRLTTGRGSPKFPTAVYYWFHVYAETPKFAHLIDKQLFGNGFSFEQEYNTRIPGKDYSRKEPTATYTDQNQTEASLHFAWQELLIKYGKFSDISVCLFPRHGLSIAGLSKNQPISKHEIALNEDFYFRVKCPLKGYLMALQEYKGQYYGLSLTEASIVLAVEDKEITVPFDSVESEILPLSEQYDVGSHGFIFLFTKASITHEIFQEVMREGAINPDKLNSYAKALLQLPAEKWALRRININFH